MDETLEEYRKAAELEALLWKEEREHPEEWANLTLKEYMKKCRELSKERGLD